MRLVDLYSYLIRIVLLGITYVYLAESRSIGTADTPTTACEPVQSYLVYTTGSCFKSYKVNRLETGELDRESLSKTNLTDCESSSAAFRAFDFYFDTSNQLNLITFDRNDGTLIGGRLNLTTSAVHGKRVLATYRTNSGQPNNQIHFVVDRPRRTAYIADKQANRIESLNLVTGERVLLTADCNSPDFIRVASGERLVWTEQARDSPANAPATCFYEWPLRSDPSNKKGKRQLACVQEKVQSFELHNSSIFYITRDGSLFKLYPGEMADQVAGQLAGQVADRVAGQVAGRATDRMTNRVTSKNSAIHHSGPTTKLIYHTVAQKRKYQIQIYRFKLIVRAAAIDLYLSDLNHQALLLANLNNANESNGRYAPRIVFTDQPSLFDFKFISLGGCKEDGSPESSSDSSSERTVDSLDRIESIGVRMADEEHDADKTGDRIGDRTGDQSSIERLYERADTKLTEEKGTLSEQMSKELQKELNDANRLIGLATSERPPANRSDNRKQLNASGKSEPSEAFCFTCTPNLIYLIVFIALAVSLISLCLLAAVFLGKRRYNTLIGGEDQSDCTFKRKLNNIQFNIKKTMQTM